MVKYVMEVSLSLINGIVASRKNDSTAIKK